MSTPYLTLAELKELSLLSSETLDEIDAANTGWFTATLAERSRWIDARLAKRYAVPFASPYPELVQGWLSRIVTWRATFRRGYTPTDLSATQLKDDADTALAEIKEAADSETGLFDLPLRADTSSSGISKGGPLGYSESSPYVGFSKQAATAHDEDRDGTGSGDQ